VVNRDVHVGIPLPALSVAIFANRRSGTGTRDPGTQVVLGVTASGRCRGPGPGMSVAGDSVRHNLKS
jgi:hypothetical protein